MKSPSKSVKTTKLKKISKSLPKTRKSKERKLKAEIKKSTSKKSKTRGWAAGSPQKGKERKALFKHCGPKCFLLPDNLKYPVCESLRVNRNCKFSCQGILAAKIRASQFHDPSIVLVAKTLENKLCKKSPKKRSPVSKKNIKK